VADKYSETTGQPRWVAGRAATNHGESLDVVVADASLRQGLVAVRQLGRAGLAVGAVEDAACGPAPAFASRWCAARSRISSRSADRVEHLDHLLDLLSQRPVDVLVPAHDGTIEAIRDRRDEVEKLCALALSSEPGLGGAIDRNETFRAATEVGVRLPASVRVTAQGDVDAALEEVGLPAVVKPVRSWMAAEGDGDAVRIAASALSDRSYAHAEAARILDAGGEALFQELVPGDREAVSFVRANGRYWGEFAQRAVRTLPAIGGSSVVRESIALPDDAASDARKLVSALELDGYAEVEFRRDREGRPVLMEINPRLSASVEIAVRSGIDFPVLVAQWAREDLGAPVSGYRIGTRMRWLGGDLARLREVLRDQDQPQVESRQQAVSEFAHDCVRPFAYDYLDRADLRPAARALVFGAWNLSKRARRKLEAARSAQ
jgi:predicted ATP-grasp superfamily ATP-dependent carboligase